VHLVGLYYKNLCNRQLVLKVSTAISSVYVCFSLEYVKQLNIM
jgi:hypothetical protein